MIDGASRAAAAGRAVRDDPGDRGKRALDVIGAILGMGLLGLVALPLGIVIRFDSRGPVLFAQERVGRGGRHFLLWKFRTMRTGTETREWTARDDPRVTRVGRFLRRSHLDELPQMWNVLRGEMSLVGPRPERPEILDELARDDPRQRQRLRVLPGVTSLSAVEDGYAGSAAAAAIRLRSDLDYLSRRCLVLDIQILVRSVIHSARLQGR